MNFSVFSESIKSKMDNRHRMISVSEGWSTCACFCLVILLVSCSRCWLLVRVLVGGSELMRGCLAELRLR